MNTLERILAAKRAVLVLVHETHFEGGPGAFLAARAAVGLPMLFKEFFTSVSTGGSWANCAGQRRAR